MAPRLSVALNEKPQRPLLYNIELEQSLLGGLLTSNPSLQSCSGLRSDHFFEPVHQAIFAAIQSLIEAKKPANPITVNPMLPQGQQVAGMSSAQYLARLCAEATSTINVADYAADVSQFHRARMIDAANSQMLTDLANGRHVKEATTSFYGDIDAIRIEAADRQTIVTLEASSESYIERAMAITTNTATYATPTGLKDLDEAIGGFCAGDLIVAAGRPGIGKSTLVASVARQAAALGSGVAFFSLEMSRDQLMSRFIADEAWNDPGYSPTGEPKTRLEYQRIFHPKNMNEPELCRMVEAQKRFAGLPMMIDYSSRLTVGEIAVRTSGIQRTLRSKFGKDLKLVIIDYIKFVQAGERYRGNRVYEIGEITAALKQLAKDMGITVMLLAQLSRAVENTDDKRPQLQHLRESGDLEADADTVLLLYRESYYLQQDPDFGTHGSAARTRFAECLNTLEINIPKNRMGPTRWLSLFCDMGCSVVRCAEKKGRDEGRPDMPFDGFNNG